MSGAIADPFAADDDVGSTSATSNLNTVDLDADKKTQENMFPPEMPQHQASHASGGSRIFEITVSDPEKKGDGMYAYVTYKVNTKLETSPGQFRQSSVTRRYSDFLFLRKRLLALEDGWLIPPIPDKAIIGRFSPMFVDSRRRGLELFLNRLARHKHLSQAEDLKVFLHGGAEFDELKAGILTTETEEKAPSSKKGFMDYFNELSQTVSNTWGAGKERQKTKDDITCESIGAYADQLDASVGAVHKNISVLTARMKDIATAWFDFGFSCTLLGQFQTEQEEQHLGNAFAKLGNCADRLSVLLTQKVDNQIVHFEEPFDDFIRTVAAVKEMLKARSAALLTYQTAYSGLEAKRAQLAKYQGKPGKEAQCVQLEMDVTEAQRKLDEAQTRLQDVTERVISETARFRAETRTNFKNIMQDFVRMQIENARKIQAAWESILPDIESMPYDDPTH